jgi:PleD family two-component response regulator
MPANSCARLPRRRPSRSRTSTCTCRRIRISIAALRIPRLDRPGTLRPTSSLGVAASGEPEKDALIADADAALYEAKRQGKNRTVAAPPQAAT